MSDADAMALIEDIITCVNVFASMPQAARLRTKSRPNDIYIFAYKELSLYLKHLFVYYDRTFGPFDSSICDWSWCQFLEYASRSPKYDRVTVVTYNYDIWLERMLLTMSIPFNAGMVGVQDPQAKITIYKPHGSVSFAHKTVLDRAAFVINEDYELTDGSVSDFDVKYDALDERYLVNALIPPAGEAGRLRSTWASEIRNKARQVAGTLTADDELIVCGLSYWHVDRAELDELLIGCTRSVNVKMLNPRPCRAMNAVVTSVFDNYISYTSAKVLEELMV